MEALDFVGLVGLWEFVSSAFSWFWGWPWWMRLPAVLWFLAALGGSSPWAHRCYEGGDHFGCYHPQDHKT